jgi:Bacterial regulatory proteins, tetR family
VKSRRPYESPTRKEHAELTRQRILEALIDLLVKERPATISIPAVAKYANVSVRTVYHHFPTKEALFDALPEASRARGGSSEMPDPTSPKEVAARMPEAFAYFERNEALFNAMRTSDAREYVTAELDRRAVSRAETMVSPLADYLSQDDLARMQGLMGMLVSYDTYRSLTRRYGLSVDEAAKAVSWAVTVLADRAKRSGRVGDE